MKDTNLIFILGSGRCGTKALVKMLSGTQDLEAHHEYCRYAYQREAVLYDMHFLSRTLIERRLEQVYTSAAYYSDASQFLDSSHKLVPVADLLVEMYPEAKFIHLIRNGYKVASSFYYKLPHICDEDAFRKLMNFVHNPGRQPVPPPSEKYWFIPAPESFDRFQRIAWMWAEYNRRIENALQKADNKILVRLEDITTNKNSLEVLTDFIGVKWNESYWKALQRPDHVYVPIDYGLTEEQAQQFDAIASIEMAKYDYPAGYERSYHVSY